MSSFALHGASGRFGRALALTGALLLGGGAAVLAPAAALAAPAAPSGSVAATFTGPPVEVIVRSADGAGPDAAERAVAAVGGSVGRRLALIGGLTARVPRDGLPALRRAAGVGAVTVNAPVRLNADTWQADRDVSSLHNITKYAGAHDAWGTTDASGRKVTGTGVGVALIDSGVAPVPGLTGAGKIVNGPDLSFESQADNLRYLDTYGHGTHLAGIIAGRDDAADPGDGEADHFVGVAPGAHVVSLKVAAADGATDVSQVIAAIDWVVQHRDDPGMNIRVLNLSFGTDSAQDPRLDPLSHAVEVAWRKGIVVVVATGNDGAERDTLTMPAVNPYVIAVGAADPNGTTDRADDTVAGFSTRGNADRHADLVAAGRSVVSLRNPGSYVDATFPGARVEGDPTQRFFRGSGTSQSAAVVSGAAALLLQHRPTLTPDQVKKLLTDSAAPMPRADALGRGAGQLDVARALQAATPAPSAAAQGHPASLGTGSLEDSRGSAHVADSETGVELTGERDIFGRAWDGAAWAASATQERSWTGGAFNGVEWAGADWTGSSWTARTWSARTWSARTWSGGSWTARTWSNATWTAAGWSARTWSARTWSARTWSARTWSARTWSSGYWAAGSWR
ncbi:MAG TPA: S8 family serine peptidase [Pilimelia sp.]|nr:S8 family serine peptidase [Pilimelia sp.]